MSKNKKIAVLIAGPTASGKSELGLSIAEALDGVIINADSMQVYDALPMLTARPGLEDMARARHMLYGFVPPAMNYSVGHWLDDVTRAIDDVRSSGKLPIILGGTGLYFSALLKGLSPIPDISPDVRAHWRAEAERLEGAELHKILSTCDLVMAQRLEPGDRQRIVRALEVLDDTGQSLAEWQKLPGNPLLDFGDVAAFQVAPERAELYARIETRFDWMMEHGALEEVRALLDLELDPGLPVMRALGVRDLRDHLAGALSLDEAVTCAKTQTRRYAKRQLTWLRRNMIAWKPVDQQFMERNWPNILSFIED